MRKLLTITSILILVSGMTYSQTRAVTEEGDTILIYKDGTWKPVEKKANLAFASIGTVTTSIEIDETTKSKTITTEQWRYLAVDSKSKSVTGSMYKKNGIYMISLIYSGNLGCLSKDESSLKIKLSNGFIIECVQISKSDCGSIQRGDFVLLSLDQSKLPDYMTIMQNNLQLLATHDWEMMRLQGRL